MPLAVAELPMATLPPPLAVVEMPQATAVLTVAVEPPPPPATESQTNPCATAGGALRPPAREAAKANTATAKDEILVHINIIPPQSIRAQKPKIASFFPLQSLCNRKLLNWLDTPAVWGILQPG